jgi:hypothetical protein
MISNELHRGGFATYRDQNKKKQDYHAGRIAVRTPKYAKCLQGFFSCENSEDLPN